MHAREAGNKEEPITGWGPSLRAMSEYGWETKYNASMRKRKRELADVYLR